MKTAWQEFVDHQKTNYLDVASKFDAALRKGSTSDRQTEFQAALSSAQTIRDAWVQHRTAPQNGQGSQSGVYTMPSSTQSHSYETSYLLDTLIADLDALVAQSKRAYIELSA